MGRITTEDYRASRGFYGVFVDGKPAGRVRVGDDLVYRGFTNRREPGKAGVGGFRTLEAAAEAVAREGGYA